MQRRTGPIGWTTGTLKRGLSLGMVADARGRRVLVRRAAPSVAAPTPRQARRRPAPRRSSASAAADLSQYIGNPDPALCGDKEWTIGYDAFSDTESFAVALKQGLEKTAADLGCVTIKALVDNADAATAVQNAKVLAQQKVDGAILFNVIQAASMGQSQALEAADIPLVSLAVPVEGYPFITNDDAANGLQAGEALGKAFKASGQRGRCRAHRSLRRPGFDQAAHGRRHPGPEEHGARRSPSRST